jgi:hypothetical protein
VVVSVLRHYNEDWLMLKVRRRLIRVHGCKRGWHLGFGD